MSESISCSSRAASALELVRRGEELPESIVRALGEECPAEFFRSLVEPLCDSFDPDQAAACDHLFTAWIPPRRHIQPTIPPHVRRVYVLSRVTLGADIKITSMILDAMKRRFPEAHVVLVGNRKCAELFPGVEHLNADYPRTGPVSERVTFAHALSNQLDLAQSDMKGAIVIDPDSRITQLGLIPIGPAEHFFHFPSRIADSSSNLSGLTAMWLRSVFGAQGEAYTAPGRVDPGFTIPYAAISLGTGGNDTKRLSAPFEAKLIELLCDRYGALWIDRGAGGEEAQRVNAAVGKRQNVRFWEGSFAGFASLISQAALYAGYDSAGQHAAAACGTPLVTVFAGAPSTTFRKRWAPEGKGPITVIDAHNTDEPGILARLSVLRP